MILNSPGTDRSWLGTPFCVEATTSQSVSIASVDELPGNVVHFYITGNFQHNESLRDSFLDQFYEFKSTFSPSFPPSPLPT
jgi:hypothetical protein